MLHTSYPTCMYLRSRACFSGRVYSYRHLMSTTQLDRSRSPTMPCILLVYIYIYIYIYTYIYIYRKIAASCTTRLARSRSPITGAALTVIPIQRQHAHKIAIADYMQETDIEGRCVSLQKAQRKRRHDYPDAEVARRDRAAQSSQATKNCRGSETAEVRERRSTRDRERRKRRLDSESATHDACIAENVSSYIS